MKALLLILLAGAANALEIKAPSPNSGAITPSTVTITGTGSKCLSVDDPTLVVDCNLNRVGIGVAAPDEVLHVVGGVNPRIKLGGTSGSPGYILDGGTADAGIFNVSGLGDISLHTGDAFTQRMTILTANGNVGIGTASPAATLDVNGNAQFGSGATKSTFTATGFWEPISKTKAQIDVLVPTKVGQVIDCSDCALPGLCRSTGTLAAQWRKMESATLGCGTNN